MAGACGQPWAQALSVGAWTVMTSGDPAVPVGACQLITPSWRVLTHCPQSPAARQCAVWPWLCGAQKGSPWGAGRLGPSLDNKGGVGRVEGGGGLHVPALPPSSHGCQVGLCSPCPCKRAVAGDCPITSVDTTFKGGCARPTPWGSSWAWALERLETAGPSAG